MSKRHALYDKPTSASKKVKLDVLVNSQTNCNNALSKKDPLSNTKRIEYHAKSGSSNGNLDDVWGDDIDADMVEDLMLVATQLTQAPNPNVSELPSFTEFRPPRMCSTQITHTQVNDKKNIEKNKPDDKQASTELNIPSFSLSKLNTTINTQRSNKNNFNLNTKAITHKNINLHESQIENRVEDLKARLHDVNEKHNLQDFEKLSLEYERLKVEHGKAIDKCLTKEGEVTFLRSQLVSCKAAVESLKIEKLQLNEKSRLELNKQLALAKKQINDLSSQLKFKDLEILNANDRTRLLESKKIRLTEPHSQRLSDVSNNLSSPKIRSIRIDKRPTNSTAVQTSSNFKIFFNEDSYQDYPLLESVPKEFYEECKNEFYNNDITKYPGNKHHDCLSIPSLLSDIYLLSKLSGNELQSEDINSSLFKIISITRALILKVSESLMEPNKQLQKRLSRSFKNDLIESNTNIFQAHPWKNEIFIELRRCLAVTSTLILYCPYIRQFIMETDYERYLVYNTNNWIKEHKLCLRLHHKDSKNILTLLLFIIDSLPESNLYLIHEGLLLSITEFIISCYKTIPNSKDLSESIMKALVFSKASTRVIQKIAELLEFLSIDGLYLEFLCFDSKEKLLLDINQGLNKSPRDSCFLQVFAVTLETCIPKSYIHQDEYNILHNLSRKVINFVHNALINNLKWTYPHLNCLCLSSVMTSIIVLLNYCVDQYKSRVSTFINDKKFFTSLGCILDSGISTLHQLLIRDSEQHNGSLQLGYFGGKFHAIVKFASDMKEENSIFLEQVLNDLNFHTSPPHNNLKFNEIFEDTFCNLKFNLTT